ncbi:MAG: hypothetical protein ACP5TZ_05650 [Nitrososphaeria archaeon]
MGNNQGIIKKIFKDLIDMESNLAGLYVVLSQKSRGTTQAAFRKISIDSMNHSVTLRIIREYFIKSANIAFSDEELREIIKKTNEISIQAKRIINELKNTTKIDERAIIQLNRLEMYEGDALEIYQKFHKLYIPNRNDIVLKLIEGIINDEMEHEKLLQLLG